MSRAQRFFWAMLILLVIVLVVILARPAGATTYYVKTDGNNASAGTSWGTAWAHPNKTNGSLSSGDSVIFAAGVYDTCYIVPTANITYTCSSSVISATKLRSGRTLSSNTADWTQFSGNVYSYDNTLAPTWHAWYSDGDGAAIQDYQVLKMQTSTTLSEGEAYYNVSTDVLYVYARGGGNPGNYNMNYSDNCVFHLDNASFDNVVIEKMTLDGGAQGVIVIADGRSGGTDNGTPSGGIVQDCIIQNSGSTEPGSNQAIIYCGVSWSSGIESELGQDWKFLRDTVRYSKGASDVAEHQGAGIDLYTLEQVTCSSVVFINLDGTGLNFKNGYGFEFDIDNIVVKDCIFNNVKTGVRIGGHSDSVIVCGNQFINCTFRGMDISSSNGTQYPHNRVKVFNNTFYNNPQPIMISPISGSTGSGNEVRYNVVFDTTSRDYSILIDVQGGEAPAQTPATDTYWEIDSNLYYHGGDAFLPFTDAAMDCDASDWTDWQTCGFDGGGLNTTNPNFAASQTPTLTRPGASNEMNRTYAGRTWTILGALQNDEEQGSYVRLRARVR